MKEEKKIFYDTAEAAQYKEITLKGWWSGSSTYHKKSVFWGEDEHMARWDGCTHLKCACGKEHSKHYTCCDDCRKVHTRERYEKLQLVEWDGVTPITTFDDDKYFFSEDDLLDYIYNENVDQEDLMLVLCKPNYAENLEIDRWEDDLPEDSEGPDWLIEAIDAFNKAIKDKGPLSWGASNKRINYKLPDNFKYEDEEG
jgi:hypothetical protein